MDSAAHRTPAELWTEILKLSTSWLILPTQGDILSNLSYDIRDCEHIHRYISSLVTRARLRRVCRSWNAVIESMDDHFVLSDLSGTYWPSLRHISTSSFIYGERNGIYCICGAERGQKGSHGLLLPSDLPPVSASELTGESTPFSGPLIAHILHLGIFHLQILPYIILEEIPSLQVLSWTPYIEDDICGILRRFTGLTHLSLILTNGQASQCSGHLDLPSVEYLHLLWWSPSGRTEGGDSFSNWHMPKLTVLKMTGDVSTVTMNDLELFVSKVGHSIIGLLLDLAVKFDVQVGNTRICNSCPNLSILGVLLYWFQPWLRRPSSMPHELASITVSSPLTIYIANFDTGTNHKHALQTAVNLVKWCQEHPCTISRIMIGHSWKFLARDIYNNRRQLADEGLLVESEDNTLKATMGAFLGEVGRSSIPICDCQEVLLNSQGATWFRDGLSAGFTADMVW